MMETSCPSLEEILAAAADPGARESLLVHAAGCPDCLEALDAVEEGLEPVPVPLRQPVWRRTAWLAAGAAAILAAAGFHFGTTRFTGTESARGYRFTIGQGEQIGRIEGELAAPAGSERSIRLPDGTRLRLEPGCRIRLQPPASGYRSDLVLVEGALEADVPPGKGISRIRGETGEIRVLGTLFRAKAFRIEGAIPCLYAAVRSGAVLLEADGRSIRIGSGEHGAAVQGVLPGKQPVPQVPDELLRSFIRQRLIAQQTGNGEHAGKSRLLAGLILGGGWEGESLDGGRDADPELREAVRALRGMR